MKKMTIVILCLLITGCVMRSNSRATAVSGDIEITEDTSRYEVPRFTREEPDNQLLERYSYVTSYNRKTRTPNWVGWMLTAEHTCGDYARKNHKFVEDRDVPRPRALYSDIREGECGYQRGHICPAGDNKWAEEAQRDAFLMTNICPQNGDLNQRDWKYLENQCRTWAKEYGQIYIVAGPIFHSSQYTTVGENEVAVPDAFFKVILTFNEGKAQCIGFVYPNTNGHNKMVSYAHSVDYVEDMTGLDFFHQLDDDIENDIEAREDYYLWQMP